MALLVDVLRQHRDVSKETQQALLLGVDSSLALRVVRLDDSGNLIFSTDPVTPPKVQIGAVFDLLPAAEADLVSYVCPVGKKASLLGATGTGDGLGRFTLELNGVWVWENSNSYATHGVEFAQRLVLSSGELLKLLVCNKSLLSLQNSYKGFLYLREESI